MFVKKLVEKATKKPGLYLDSLKPEDVEPRVAFHYGVPSAAAMLAYDPIQKIVAVSTKNGQIKLLGKDNTQAMLESTGGHSSKFLQFVHNRGVLLNVTFKNQIEVWDIDRKFLSHVHDFSEEITSFTIMQQCVFIFIGDSTGNVTVWRLNQELCHLEKLKYFIPFSASHGSTNEDASRSAVMYVLPQPTAESKRILLVFADGLMTLWAIQESKAIFTIGGTAAQLLPLETKTVTSASWVCPFGSKVAVGYSTGAILLYSFLSNSDIKSGSSKCRDSCNPQNVHISKLNLEYRLEKIPIASLKWVSSDGKASRLYVIGACDATPTKLVQVILLNEDIENRTIKLGLQLPEPCLGIEVISCLNQQSKHKQGFLLLLGKTGHMYAYDDHAIEKYLVQSQTMSPPSIPSEVMIKLPYCASSTTSAQFITNQSDDIGSWDEDYLSVAKDFPGLLSFEAKHFNPPPFTGLAKIRNLYITGHGDGTIKFWDVRSFLFIPLLSVSQQIEDDSSSCGVAVTAIFYCTESRILFSGDKSGIVCIYQLKPEPFARENSFFSLPGSSKKGSNHVIHSVNHIKVNGPVVSLSISNGSKHLAVGCEQGHISLIDVEDSSVLYHKQIGTELSADVISLQFECCDFHGFEKNILVLATRDSSLLVLDRDTGNTLNSSAVHPKKRSRALFMQILDTSKGALPEDTARKQQSLLLCSEKAVYVYSLPHAIQGEKKVCYKKKFHLSSCCWASVICSASRAGLGLVFSCGKTEIRSLPDLSLVKEATLRSFTHLPSKPSSTADYFICSSTDGEVIMIRSDQEIAVHSMLLHNEAYRHLGSFSQIYDKNLMASEEGLKKKGIFGSVFNDVKGSKAIHGAGDARAGFEDLLTIFSLSNFPEHAEVADNKQLEIDDVILDIDDIDLNDEDDKPKRHNVSALLNNQKLASKFQSFKGKLKQMTAKTEKFSAHEEAPIEKGEAVDQIKKKYGFSTPELGIANIIESKLTENVKKIQGIDKKTTEMQDNAQSFSAMAKETLRILEHKNNPDQI